MLSKVLNAILQVGSGSGQTPPGARRRPGGDVWWSYLGSPLTGADNRVPVKVELAPLPPMIFHLPPNHRSRPDRLFLFFLKAIKAPILYALVFIFPLGSKRGADPNVLVPPEP